MKIIKDMEQLSEEWFAVRAKRMTASHAQAIGNAGKGLETYIHNKMAEYYSNAEKEHYSNADTERGNEFEGMAGVKYAWDYFHIIERVGFVVYNDYVGVSPDLFVDDDGMAEIKCPKDTVYFKLLLDRKVESKYIWQMQMQMLVCKKKWCDFVAYNPNYGEDLFVERIYPNEKKFEKLEKGFDIGEKLIKDIGGRI